MCLRQGFVSFILATEERDFLSSRLRLWTSRDKYNIKHSTTRATNLLTALVVYAPEFIFAENLLFSSK
jgi:hypothetical protein